MSEAVRTWYRGYHMRSRLEATWARRFDNLDWFWKYEPIHTDGYDPDFLVAHDTFVEIKPETKVEELALHLPKCLKGLDSIGYEDPFVILGSSPTRRVIDRYGPLGPGIIAFKEDGKWFWESAVWSYCEGSRAYGLKTVTSGIYALGCMCADDYVIHELGHGHRDLKSLL